MLRIVILFLYSLQIISQPTTGEMIESETNDTVIYNENITFTAGEENQSTTGNQPCFTPLGTELGSGSIDCTTTTTDITLTGRR